MPAVQSRLTFGSQQPPMDPRLCVRKHPVTWVKRQELLHNDKKPQLPLQMLMVCAGIGSPGRAMTEWGAMVGNGSWSRRTY